MPDSLYAYRFPRWKWPIVRQCFSGRRIFFLDKSETIPPSAWLLLWGMAPIPLGATNVRILRLEDGFIRSVGLGAELVRPLSWVVDGRGIHYDATRTSDLEQLLSQCVFDEALRTLAASLRAKIVDQQLTKYNVGFKTWQRPQRAHQVILVAGQVESDASLAYGAPGVQSNMGLLRAVRSANPGAYVVYKPHPDVIARLRKGGVNEQDAATWCDEIVADVSMGHLLSQVDEVHVLTSLSGFEALLRGKTVTCYGQPFYSGWGLTRDIYPNLRRQRKLTLDELVAGALIKYPLYLSRDGKCLIKPAEALDSLLQWREHKGVKDPWWRSIYRFFLRIFIGVR